MSAFSPGRFGNLVTTRVSTFFDSTAVIRATTRAERQVLSRFGAFVRQTAKTSITRRKQPSDPGDPPKSHTGDLRRSILFGFDIQQRSVVIGPATGYGDGRQPFGKPIPLILEEGGRTQLEGKILGGKPAAVRSRPFMLPALEKERDKFPSLWTDSVKG